MNNTELTARTNQITATFQAVHNGIKGDALAMKLKMFFAGLLVNELKEIHFETYGETRGGDQKSEDAKSKGKAVSVLIGPWLEQHLGVTARTCRNYHTFWQSITQSTLHAGAVQALNKWWIEHRPSIAVLSGPTEKPGKGKGKAKEDTLAHTPSQSAFISLHASGIVAKDLEGLLEEADALGLHELFERPAKDVTPQQIEQLEEGQKDKQLELALQFWGPQSPLQKRLAKKEYLHLPAQEREALATTLKEALHDLEDTLKTSKR